MDTEKFIAGWLRASNNFDTEKYLEMYHKEAILDDPSVGRKFEGYPGIRDYFESYFTGFNTQTQLTDLSFIGDKVHLEVEFTGDFPEGRIGGIFDFMFKEGKIAAVKADLK